MEKGYVRFICPATFLIAAAMGLLGCPEQQLVFIADPGLEQAIRAELGKPFGFFTEADMLELRTLDARNSGIRNLAGLEWAVNLWWLDLDTNAIADLTPLTELVDLMVLNLDTNEIFDISPLAGLLNLDALSLFDNQIGDIKALVTNAVNGGLGPGDHVILDVRHLSEEALFIDVPALQALGVNVLLVEPAGE
jgi:Leucine-rich repeat (LRR) protein